MAAVTPTVSTGAQATEISADDFARQTHALLLTKDRTQANKLLLAGAVQYQLTRAAHLFSSGYTQEAADTVTGALLLLRHDDELLSATRGQGTPLLEAAHAAARAGDAGRAEALYELSLAVIEDDTQKQDIQAHLQALATWSQETQGATALEQIGEKTRAALARSVVDPRAEAYIAARDNIISWMRAALSSSVHTDGINSRAEREIALEAYRAIRSGAPALIALNTRQGTPAAAVTSLEEADLERALPPGLRALLEATASDDNPDAWLSLFRQLEDSRAEGGSETQLPAYVTDAAAFWASVSLYRSAPGKFENAMPLAMTLVEFGMPEVASSLLSQNSDKTTKPEALAWSLTLVLRGLLELSRTDQLEAARRSYHEALPLIRLAEGERIPGPGPARAHALMAALETRHGHAKRALPLLESSVALEPHTETLLRLARLQSQAGEPKEAQKSLQASIAAAQKSGDLLAESRAEEALARSYREEGKVKETAEALERALNRVLVLRKMDAATQSTAAIERQLARVLEYFGESHAVRDAYARALAASRDNPLETEMTLTDMARAALTWNDLRLARSATQSALDLGLPEENAIYIALWQQILESQLKASPDGLSRTVLTGASDSHGWLRNLRDFGLGQLPATGLAEKAPGIPEKAEADFYAAFQKSTPSSDQLKEIALSPAVDLIEVRIAQDLLSQDSKRAQPKLPSSIELP